MNLFNEDRISTRVRQGRRLDQQALSFVAAARSAESHDNGAPGAFHLRTPRRPRIARGQKLEISEADAVQTCRAGIFHHQQVTGFAASVTLPLPVQWLNHHQIRGTAYFLCQALAFPLGKLFRYPMGPVQRLDRRVAASAETQRLTPRVARSITCRAREQASSGRPGPEKFHGFRYARQLALHDTLEIVDLTSPPLFHLPGIQPPDPDEHIDRACIALGGQRRLRGLDDTLRKRVPVLRVHRCKNPVLRHSAHPRCAPNVSTIIHRAARDFQDLLDVVTSAESLLVERHADALFFAPDNVAGHPQPTAGEYQGEMLGDANRTGYIERSP